MLKEGSGKNAAALAATSCHLAAASLSPVIEIDVKRCYGLGGPSAIVAQCLCPCPSLSHTIFLPQVVCDTVRKWITKNSAESENLNWILANTKPCPKCCRPIEKNQGCMHMTCSQCRCVPSPLPCSTGRLSLCAKPVVVVYV